MPTSLPTLSPGELLLKYDRPVPRYTSYPTAAAFSSDVGERELRSQLAMHNAAPLSLYVHIPFCRHACWYCGCNRITTQLGRQQLQLWALIERHFDLDPQLEASIEVNPEFLNREAVLHLRQLGFQRLSFGVQDADPVVQKAVNRVVPSEQLRRVMGWLREADFASVNVDLICGLPLQTPERFRRTLALVQELRPERVALFSFAYLPDQLPLQRRIAAVDLPDQRQRITMLEEANRMLRAAGYVAIGMDHYALADDSLAVAARRGGLHRNFQGYTTGGELELLGIGPTAISQFERLFSQNQRHLKAYASALERGELPVERGLVVRDPEVLERRALIRALMCDFQAELDPGRFATEWERLGELARDGLVELVAGPRAALVRVTPQGRWLVRTIAAVFDPEQRRQATGSRLV
jgi:oxygen-independent coproporphyrinogen-3 oxidase